MKSNLNLLMVFVLSLSISYNDCFAQDKHHTTVSSLSERNTSKETLSVRPDPEQGFPESILSFHKHQGRHSTEIKRQSPIDIHTASTVKFSSTDPVVHYQTVSSVTVEHAEKHMRIGLSEQDQQQNYITIKGDKYKLKQFHFHQSSEHTIDGKRSLMEIHFVNVAEDGSYAVLAVLVNEGAENTTLENLFTSSFSTAHSGSHHDGIKKTNLKLDLHNILPDNLSNYYTYLGSLTTPNLDLTENEGLVTFIVFKNPQHVSLAEFNDYHKKYKIPAYRTAQSLNGRIVYENVAKGGSK